MISTVEAEDELDDNEEVNTTPELRLTEALAALEEVSAFLESRGFASEATDAVTVSNITALLHCKHQTLRL